MRATSSALTSLVLPLFARLAQAIMRLDGPVALTVNYSSRGRHPAEDTHGAAEILSTWSRGNALAACTSLPMSD